MTPHPKTIKWLLPAMAGLALACTARVALAQGVQDYIVSQFDDGTVQGWAFNYGGAVATVTNSPDFNHGDAGPGALNVTAPFNLCTLAGNNQTDFEKALSAPIDLTKYTKIHFSVYVDTNSAHLSDWGAGAMGNLRPHIRLSSWGGDVSLAVNSADSQWVPLGNYGKWTDYSMTIDQTGAGKLPTLQACGVLGFQIWSGWGTCAAPIGLTNTISFWLDNIWFEFNTNTAPPPPPTTALKKAGPNGVMIAMGSGGGQYDRQAISTPAPDGAYIWTAQGGYPVSYSCTITDFPPVNTHRGYEAHMYIVNGDTAGPGNNTYGAPDWNCPDVLIFRIENVRNTILTTNGSTITTNFTYNAMAQIQWKTNFLNGNATNVPVLVFPPSVPGTWTVTFTDPMNGTLSGPGITATNFTLPGDAVTNNFSPATSFVQFGNFKNDGPNDGHNNDATGTFSQVQIAGTNAPINDSFSGNTLTNNYAWRKTSANEVVYVAPGTKWYFSWSVPALGFNPYVSPSVTGPWSLLSLVDQFQNGTNVIGEVAASALPAGNTAFFRMAKYPFVKLQVLMPGETAAPGTATGKTGTPTTQAVGATFNVTVNAVDQFWNLSPFSTDQIAITSSDTTATLPPNAALAGGTQTFPVTFGTNGTWTVTATDATDGTKTPNTGTPTVVQ